MQWRLSMKDEIVTVLEQTYRVSMREEDETWRRLTKARSAMIDAGRKHVPTVTIQKWLAHLEGKTRLDSLNPDTQRTLAKLSEWCGPENLSEWLRQSRAFNIASDEAFRTAMALKRAAGIERVAELDGERPDGDLRRKLIAVATRINPTVELNLVRQLYAEGPSLLNSGAVSADRMEVAGMHMPYFNLSTISLSPKFDALDTAYHEMWHSLEPVLTRDEQRALAAAFPGDNHMTHKERTAVAFAAWATDKDRGGEADALSREVQGAFRKAKATGKTIANVAGARRIEKIFQRAYGGEIGKRVVEGFKKMGGRESFLPPHHIAAAVSQSNHSSRSRGRR